MIIDEAHSLFIDPVAERKGETVDSFVMATRASPYPKVYLTATLAPKHVASFVKNAGLEDGTRIIRKKTDRPNLATYVLSPTIADNLSAHDMLYNLISHVTHHLEAKANAGVDELAVIYDASIKNVTAIATHFDLPLYHAKLSSKEKALNLGKWQSGNCPTIVATSALGTGIDYPNIRYVVLNGPIYGLYNYVQSIGRAGRDGQTSFVITIYDPKPTSQSRCSKPYYDGPAGAKDPIKIDILADMKKYLDHQGCRRAFSTGIMDGELGVSCNQYTPDQACDQCSPAGEYNEICAWTRTRKLESYRDGQLKGQRSPWQPKLLARTSVGRMSFESVKLPGAGQKRARSLIDGPDLEVSLPNPLTVVC